jgi:hypothetical protein
MKHTCEHCEACQKEDLYNALDANYRMISFWLRFMEVVPWLAVFFIGFQLGMLVSL